jgi:hypothetical protein
VTGTLAAPLAQALALHGIVVDDWQEQYTVDHGLARDILAHLRSDPEVLAALAEALQAVNASQYVETSYGTMWHDLGPNERAAAILDALMGEAEVK